MTLPSLVERELEGDLVAAERVEVVGLHVGVLERPVVVRVLVVLEDVLAVELVVHQCCLISWSVVRTVSRPAISRSMSVEVLWTANEARVVEPSVEAAHQRLGAMVAGAHADALAAEDLADVVRVGALDRERGERAAVGGVQRAVDREPGTSCRRSSSSAVSALLVGTDRVDPDLLDEIDCRAKADRLGDL